MKAVTLRELSFVVLKLAFVFGLVAVGACAPAVKGTAHQVGDGAPALVVQGKNEPEQKHAKPEKGLPSNDPFAIVDTMCPHSVSAIAGGLKLGGEGCFHGLKSSPSTPSRSLSFRARVVAGLGWGWGVSIGGVRSSAGMRALAFFVDGSALKVMRFPGGPVGLPPKTVELGTDWHRWRVVRTDSRLIVWLDDELLLVHAEPNEPGPMGIWTRGVALEVRDIATEPVAEAESNKWSALAVGWLKPDEVPAEPLDEPARPEEKALSTLRAGRLGPDEAPAARLNQPAGPEGQALSILRAYYRDLNGSGFDAPRYFAPRIARYITMRSTSPAKVNHYIRTVFPQQFREVQFSMDEGTMMQVGTNAYSYHEYASYFKVSHNEYQAFKTLVRVEFEPGGNITSFHQEKVLDKRSGTTRPLIAKPAGVSKAPREVSGGKYVPCQGALGSPVGRHDAFDDVLPKTAAGFRRESVVSIICRGGFEVLAAYTAAGVEVFVAVYIGPSGFASKEELPHTFAGFKAKIEEKGVAVQPSSRSLLIVGKAGDEEKTKQLLLAMEPASLERKILAIAERLSK